MSYKELTEQLGEGNEALTLVKAVSEENVVSQNKISCDYYHNILIQNKISCDYYHYIVSQNKISCDYYHNIVSVGGVLVIVLVYNEEL
jgi:hypothetical protein